MILRSAGFVTSALIGAQNTVNFAYILFLRGRAENLPAADLERLVRRWYALSVLTRRYSKGNPETDIDYDIRQIEAAGLIPFCKAVISSELSDNFWTNLLPIELETSSPNSPSFLAYQAAQVKLGDKGFLSRDITVLDLLMNRSDVHHVYPRNHLKKQGLPRGRYNQIGNFVLAQSEINIAIGDKAPERYFQDLARGARLIVESLSPQSRLVPGSQAHGRERGGRDDESAVSLSGSSGAARWRRMDRPRTEACAIHPGFRDIGLTSWELRPGVQVQYAATEARPARSPICYAGSFVHYDPA